MTNMLETYKRYLACQLLKVSRSKPSEEKKKVAEPFVTISRETGAGGTTVARELCKILNENQGSDECPWAVFDKLLVREALDEHNLPKELEKFIPEKKISEIRDTVETMLELHPPAFELVRDISETMMKLSHAGRCVIIGRGGNILTSKLPGGLHVRLIGTKEKRIQHTADFYKISADMAAKRVEEEDSGRAGYIKQNFSRDIDDSKLYDLVINTDRLHFEEIAKMLAGLIKKEAK